MNDADKKLLNAVIRKESLNYAIESYSTFTGACAGCAKVDDEKFHALRLEALKYQADTKESGCVPTDAKKYREAWGSLREYLLKEIPELAGWCEVFPVDDDGYALDLDGDEWTIAVCGQRHLDYNNLRYPENATADLLSF